MYKIIIDSCGELSDSMKKDKHFCNIPLTLEIGDKTIIDNENFDQLDFLKRVRECETPPKSACPSPNSYMEAMEGDFDHVYLITLSSQLSGSYNSACLAKDLYEEEHEDSKCIHVFDSKSASVGQTLIGMKIAECEETGMTFDEVVTATNQYISEQHTFFVLESLETLRKAGRLSNLKSIIANTLNIKPIMGSTDIGSICQLANARGMTKALSKMAEQMIEVTINSKDKILAIAHCNCPERAELLKKYVMEKANYKDIFIVNTAGVSSMYANDGGVILVV